MRLMIAEAPHFPGPLDQTHTGDSVQRALADRLAELAAEGLLVVVVPIEAAEILGPLAAGRVPNRSWYGAAQLDDAEIGRPVAGGVQIFLRAYRPAA
jgi:hypothetical protein